MALEGDPFDLVAQIGLAEVEEATEGPAVAFRAWRRAWELEPGFEPVSNRLREIGEDLNVPSYLIDDAEGLQPEWLKGKKVVGITAGASAPVQALWHDARGDWATGASVAGLITSL